MNKLLIVVDMQNDFIDGALGTPEAQSIVPRVTERIRKAVQDGDAILFTRDTHGEDYLDTQEGKRLPVKHCIKGSAGWQLADAVKEKRPDAEYVFGRSGQHKRQPNEIGIHALRMGNVVGEHEVIFATDNQTISLKHQAHDRALFADGAIAAARFIVTQAPGFYHMDDLLGP